MNINGSYRTKSFFISHIAINVLLISFCVLCIVPLMLVLSISFSNEADINKYGYSLIPHKIDLTAYQYIFNGNTVILSAYLTTITITILGTVIGLSMVTMMAYAISRNDYKYRNITSFFLFFTMLFSGGLVPWYVLIAKYLGMKDTIFALFVPYLLSPMYVFLMKSFLKDIHISIIESAKIDGASELGIFFRIIMPLSKPGLATIGLFIALGYWNDWWLPLLFINNDRIITLQYLLYRTLATIEFLMSRAASQPNIHVNVGNLPDLSARMAMCIIAAGPMLFAFPFFQRYFVKGLSLGAVKG